MEERKIKEGNLPRRAVYVLSTCSACVQQHLKEVVYLVGSSCLSFLLTGTASDVHDAPLPSPGASASTCCVPARLKKCIPAVCRRLSIPTVRDLLLASGGWFLAARARVI